MQSIVLGYLEKFKPFEWNNIPIPLQELSRELIAYSSQNGKVTELINDGHDKLTTITQDIFNFTEQS